MNTWKQIQEKVGITPDGIPGSKTLAAIYNYLKLPQHIKMSWNSLQEVLGITSDGIPGKETAKSLAKALGIPQPKEWPTQSVVRSNKSLFGKDGTALVTIDLPYPMFLAWEPETQIKRMTCHALVADPLKNIFRKILNHYGKEKINELGLDLFGGCYNDRKIVGGQSKSMHAWGIAVDMDPDHNGMNTHAPKARFSKKDYEPFWEIVEEEGAISLGREKDYDWMHFQFATL